MTLIHPEFQIGDRVVPKWSAGHGREGVVIGVRTVTHRRPEPNQSQSVSVQWTISPDGKGLGQGQVKGDQLCLLVAGSTPLDGRTLPNPIIKPPKTPYIHELAATLALDDKPTWECCLINACIPALRNIKTGHWVIFEWQTLANVADHNLLAHRLREADQEPDIDRTPTGH